MLVIARGNFLFRDNGENYLLKGGVLTSVPDWVTKSAFFGALVQEGRIAISDSTSDKKVVKAIEEAEVKEAVAKEQKKKTTKKK